MTEFQPPAHLPEPGTAPAGTPLRELATAAGPAAAAERTLPGHVSRVVLEEDGGRLREFQVRVDNRDYLRWDMTAPRQRWGKAADSPFLFATFLCWSAAKRAGEFAGSFEEFQTVCLETQAEERDGEDSDARPTR